MVETVKYRVRRRDTLSNIVSRQGFPARDWRRIYDAPYNRNFRREFPDPDQIQPGGILYLPRYSPRDLRDLVAKIDEAVTRLRETEAALESLDRAEVATRRAIERAPDDRAAMLRQIGILMAAAQETRHRAEQARALGRTGASPMTDMIGAQAPRLETMARKLDDRARRLGAEVRRQDADPGALLRQLDVIGSERARAQTHLGQMQARIHALKKEYQRASSNPYR